MRDPFSINKFDPTPMTLGERTTRQPAEPVNPPEPDDGEGDTPDLHVTVTLREMFATRVPFKGASQSRVIAAALMDKGVRFNNSAVFPSFPESLCQPAKWTHDYDGGVTVTQSRSAK